MGISPSMEFEPGPTQDYVIGGNELLFNSKGDSTGTAGTMATVVVDEIKENKHHHERITGVNS